ncbi:unnamed protein product [Urochloa humidicola]
MLSPNTIKTVLVVTLVFTTVFYRSVVAFILLGLLFLVHKKYPAHEMDMLENIGEFVEYIFAQQQPPAQNRRRNLQE